MRSRRAALSLALAAVMAGCGTAERPSSAPRPDAARPDANGRADAGRGDAESAAAGAAAGEAGFRPVRLADCAAFPQEAIDSWSSGQPGMFTTTGSPRGYLFTKRRYGDFTLVFEYRFVRPEAVTEEAELDGRNTGVLVYVPDEHRIWPRSPEVQGRHDEMAGIKSNAPDLKVAVIRDDEPMRQLARRPVGEWNEIRIVSRGGALATFLNGVKIAGTLPCELRQGHVGFQSEGHEVHFRNVRIREDGSR
ncbi:MAG TPA: DUF1080 domain-containing protein [Planctomycetaceae bacterium]|nr:DUF1080 domain-containing protein [Planctomycetaceae bacterium]